MGRLLPLEDACDPRIAGSKAARLARARSAGLPVLPGWVVPIGESVDTVRIGADVLRRSGHAAAYLAVTSLQIDADLRVELVLAARSKGGTMIVRASTEQEADPRWSGSFASYLDVAADDVPAAVRGCWASAVSRDVAARCEALDVAPADLRVAVVLQPWVAFGGGGTARRWSDGRVTVAGIADAPAVLVAGRREGCAATLSPDGDVEGDAYLGGLGRDVLAAVAALAGDVHRIMGDDAIEWGVADGRVFLLQARRAPVEVPMRPARSGRRGRRPVSPWSVDVARLADRYPAPLGDRFVLPWALGLVELPRARPLAVADPSEALAEARALARELTSRAWRDVPDVAEAEAAAVTRLILGPEPDRGLERLMDLEVVDAGDAARLLGLVAAAGDAMVERGLLPHRDFAWRCPLEELEAGLRTGLRPTLRRGPDRWEPFVAGVVEAVGLRHEGRPAAPGTGAGRLRRLEGPWSRPGPREVLVVRNPIPQVAPLLWNCAGLVTAEGSVGAHLFEVARSLGVPSVIGADLADEASAGMLAAVDGDGGVVSVLPAGTGRGESVSPEDAVAIERQESGGRR